MKIAILDAYTANPGDLSWEAFEKLGELSIYERTAPEELLERCKDVTAVLSNKVPLKREHITALPQLQYIGVTATGYNIIDTIAARENQIAVTNVPGYSTDSVAQCVFAHILELSNHTALHAEAVRNDAWTKSPDFCFWHKPIRELHNLTLGLIGFGAIAQAVAKIGRAFGMRIIAHTRTAKDIPDVEFVDRETLFKESDFISLHCPLTNDTEGIINSVNLKLMKSDALLINTGRGQLVDEQALADALNNEEIGGAGLDVLSSEPPQSNNPLLSAKNCFITPHIAWASKAARQRLIDQCFDNLKAFIGGQRLNRVESPL